jgi:hypothetical protein
LERAPAARACRFSARAFSYACLRHAWYPADAVAVDYR